MTKEEIDDAVCEIMWKDGPDGHIDGHDIITEFIMALMSGGGAEWRDAYLLLERGMYRSEHSKRTEQDVYSGPLFGDANTGTSA